MSRVDLVIFDCDGVLVDSEPLAVRLNVELGAELGWPLTEQEVMETFIGRSRTDNHAVIAARVGEEAADRWYAQFDERHGLAISDELVAVPGIADALRRIRTPACVASSGTHATMRRTLGLTGLYDHFDGRIFSATEVPRGKPAPDLFLYAAERMSVAPDRCVVVEDSRHGVAAARAAGMRALGFCGGLTPRAWLEGPGTVVFDDMADLPGLLGLLDVTNTTR